MHLGGADASFLRASSSKPPAERFVSCGHLSHARPHARAVRSGIVARRTGRSWRCMGWTQGEQAASRDADNGSAARRLPPSPDGREFPYLAAPHRLDVETEGLLVLATTPAAAARIGAAFRPREEPLRRASSTFQRARKVYRALVTPSAHLIPGSVLHHLQVKAKGAPKRFLPDFPGQPVAPGTLRCALKILSVSTPHLVPDSALPGGTGFAATLLQEVRCELLTGRTHQIRGQLAAVGASIYGDNMYCGQREEGILAPSWSHSPHLALQSCELELSEESFHCQLPRAWWSDAFLSAPGSDASMDVHTQIPAQISPGKSDSY